MGNLTFEMALEKTCSGQIGIAVLFGNALPIVDKQDGMYYKLAYTDA